MKYRSEIDGLRAVAIIPVILFHSGLGLMSGGYLGVDIFFVISGYLITSVIIEEIRENDFSIINFYERRARRILPALFLVTAVCVPLSLAFMVPAQYVDFSESLVSIVAFVSNFHFLFESGYFDQPSEYKPLLHTWSLSIEEQFYVLFPVFMLLVARFGQRHLVWLLAVICLLSLALTQFGGNLKLAPPYVEAQFLLTDVPHYAFFLLPTRGWELIVGALSAIYLMQIGRRMPPAYICEIASGVGFILILFSIFTFDEVTPVPSVFTLLPVMGTALVIVFCSSTTIIGRTLSNPAIVLTGLISYSVYLWHQPLFVYSRLANGDDPPGYWIALMAILSFGLGYLSWRFVERPFRDRKQFTRQQIFAWSGASALVLLVIGITGIATNGFLFRIAPEDRQLALLNPQEEGRQTVVPFNRAVHAEFDLAAPTKILLIGDSYAVDVMNALLASKISRGLSISTHTLKGNCLDIFVDDEAKATITPKNRLECTRDGWQSSKLVYQRAREADVVITAHAWKEKQVERLPVVVSKFESITQARLLFVGTKSFGTIRPSKLLAYKPAERNTIRGKLGSEKVILNSRIAELVGDERYVDFMQGICNAKDSCPLFTPGGVLMSYDGYHLTRAAAAYAGNRLINDRNMSYLRSR